MIPFPSTKGPFSALHAIATTPAVVEVYDGAVASLAVSSPVWLKYIDDGASTYIVVAGAILITFRIIRAYRIWRINRDRLKRGLTRLHEKP